ncbi:type VI secretion system protein TssA [Salmonella enterica]|nr:type VI secretion system protein TssA [Salmonella enterica]EGW2853021.1 type VI secretion system protein TssA [Salmonella enterica]
MEINIDALLHPISDASPAGVNVEYELVYDEIRQARVSDPIDLPQGEWSTELRKADWAKVARLSMQLLQQSSKDFQLACWLTEAFAHQHGVEGIVQGIRFLTEFTSCYWEKGWPEKAEDGEAIRHAIFTRFDRDLALFLMNTPILGKPESSLQYWRRLQANELLRVMKSESSEEELLTSEEYLSLLAQIPTGRITKVEAHLQQLIAGLQYFEKQYDAMNGGTTSIVLLQTAEVVADLYSVISKALSKTSSIEEIALARNDLISEFTLTKNESQQDNIPRAQQKMSRDLAIAQMLTIAHYFRQTEPSSPVPFLVERAARWASMTLVEWLAEMLRDENSRNAITDVLVGVDEHGLG